MAPNTVSEALFRDVLGHWASGVAIITVRDAGGRDHGMTVSAFSSLSLDPPLVLACIGHDATIAGAVAAANRFGLSVLAEHQEALSRQFAQPDTDRFEGIPMARSPRGMALVPDALAHLECTVAVRHEGGDHTIVVGEVVHAVRAAGRPLLYYRGEYSRMAR
jgi:flavin reductase (DIM6/NTAB) family NADH-FMN oxidoreductase RutF